MIAIACIDKNNAIGKNGKLLLSIPDDMRFFKKTTQDNIVIMGRKTLESFNNKMPLKQRINIVFTSNKYQYLNNSQYKNIDNLFFVSNIDELNSILKQYNNKTPFVIGGEKIYKLLLKYCDKLLLTEIQYEFEADSYFPDFKNLGYKLVEKSPTFIYNNIEWSFNTYSK